MASVTATDRRDNPQSMLITSPVELTEKMRAWKTQGAHVLAPASEITAIAPGYGINPAVVYLDPTVDQLGRGRDCYYDANKMSVGHRAPNKIGLGRLASCAGVSWLPAPHSGRLDPMTIQHLWIFQMLGVYLAADGTPQTIHGTKEIDYRDGSAQIGGWTPELWRAALARAEEAIHGWSEQRVLQARMNGNERAETGAMERAMRMGFSLQHTYTADELARPFITLRVCPLVDMTDSENRRMVNEGKLAGVAALYAGNVRRALPTAPADVIDIDSRRREPVAVGASSTVSPAAPRAAASVTPPPALAPSPAAPSSAVQQPPTPSAAPAPKPAPPTTPQGPSPSNVIRQVTPEPKTYSAKHATKPGQPYTKWHVIDGHGAEHVTINDTLGHLAQRHAETKTPVVITTKHNDQFNESVIVKIEPFDAAKAVAPVAAPQGSFKL